jgi:AraC-like DNA-binding protein
MKKVIKYINDHYMTEIPWADLALSLGIQPDSLGIQFKKYTGHRLEDYINELRVNEAARRLREEETHIIDVAFDVGFNRVKTFNRIFSKFMNESPCNYRATHRAVRLLLRNEGVQCAEPLRNNGPF